MLDANGQKSFGLQRKGFAFQIQRTHGYFVGTRHIFVDTRHRQTAFFAHLFAAEEGKKRIGQVQALADRNIAEYRLLDAEGDG